MRESADPRRDALIAWLADNGAEESAAWYRENPHEPVTLEALEDIVVERVAPGYLPAAALAPGHLAAVEDELGPIPSDPDAVGPYLDRLMELAASRLRTQLLDLVARETPAWYHTAGTAGPVALSTIRPRACTITRRGPTRATRSTRRVVRSRGSATRAGPSRSSDDDPPHDVARHARHWGGVFRTSARGPA